MRVAIISDTHLGDNLCTLVLSEGEGGPPQIGPAYEAFRQSVGRVDYLVLLGDIIDFSVASYEEAYRQAKVFFNKVREDRIAEQLVYVPGNHDFDIWHTVEQQVNVINQLKQGQLPRAFKRSVPGVIDDRPRPDSRLILPDVTAKPEWHEDHAYYGNLFLDHITRTGRKEGPKLTFNFAYPNLYLVTDSGECVLLTHGHYLEAYWSMASEWAMRLAGDDLQLETEGELSMREMVGINQPLNLLACTGIGQAQPLTQLLKALQAEVSSGKTESLVRYIERLKDTLGRNKSGPTLLNRLARAYGFWLLKGRGLDFLGSLEHTRYSRQFLNRPAVRERFRNYYFTSLNELERLDREHQLKIPAPSHVIFGHTHQPIPWGSQELMDKVNGHQVRLCNTGGWLIREGAGDFRRCGSGHL